MSWNVALVSNTLTVDPAYAERIAEMIEADGICLGGEPAVTLDGKVFLDFEDCQEWLDCVRPNAALRALLVEAGARGAVEYAQIDGDGGAYAWRHEFSSEGYRYYEARPGQAWTPAELDARLPRRL